MRAKASPFSYSHRNPTPEWQPQEKTMVVTVFRNRLRPEAREEYPEYKIQVCAQQRESAWQRPQALDNSSGGR